MKKTENTKEQYETVFIPKEHKNDEAQYVAVNGQRILVRKGEAVSLPKRYAEVIKNSFSAAKEAESFIDTVCSND